MNSGTAVTERVRVLLTDSDRRPYAARLAIGLSELGCEVSIVSTRNHPIEKTAALHRRFSYSALHPLESLMTAIREVGPDIIVPCDDRAVDHLHRLHQLCKDDAKIAGLVERSIGHAASFPIVSARYELIEIARKEHLRVPATSLLRNSRDLERWTADHPFPWILKTDGTWGGRGVRLVNSSEEAIQQFQEMKRPCGFKRAIKRFVVNRDAFYLREWRSGHVPSVIIQRVVPGRPANCAVFCWEGKVLAGIAVEVVASDGATGPASVVRVIDNVEMMTAAQTIAQRLQISGFFGLDFIIEEGTGAAVLIEMNPRCTPLCHLRLGKGKDMLGALLSTLANRQEFESVSVTSNSTIAYFPQAWLAASELLSSSYHDYPNDEPELARELLRPWPERTLIRRAFVYWNKPSPSNEGPVLESRKPEVTKPAFDDVQNSNAASTVDSSSCR